MSKTIREYTEAATLLETDALYLTQSTASGASRHILASNGLLAKYVTASSTSAIDLSTYGGDVNIMATGTITLTLSSFLPVGKSLKVLNIGSGVVTLAGAIVATMRPQRVNESVSTGAAMQAVNLVSEVGGVISCGPINCTTLDATGAVGIDGNFDIATNKFTVVAATGVTTAAGLFHANAGIDSLSDITSTGNFETGKTIISGSTGTAGSLTIRRASDGANAGGLFLSGNDVVVESLIAGSDLQLKGLTDVTFYSGGVQTAVLNSAGTMSLGNTAPKTWDTAQVALQLGKGAAIAAGNASSTLFIMNHIYTDGSNWRFLGSDSKYGSLCSYNNGTYYWSATTTAGTDGNVATLAERMQLTQSGVLSVGNTAPKIWAGTTAKPLQIGMGTSILAESASSFSYINTHLYYSTGWKFLGSDAVYGCSYTQYNGIHSWVTTTAQGTDGGVATLINQMRLLQSGELLLGTDTSFGSAATKQVIYNGATTGSYTAYQTLATGTGIGNGCLFGYDDTAGATINNYENTGFRVITNNLLRLTISATGFVDISSSIAGNYISTITNSSATGVGVLVTVSNSTSNLILAAQSSLGTIFKAQANGLVYMPTSYATTITASPRAMYIDSAGKVGTLTSTGRAKTNIVYGINTDWIHDLKTVEFEYRKQSINSTPTNPEWLNEGTGEKTLGLIAEDVELVRPDLVIHDEKEPEKLLSVEYTFLITPMLNEIQKSKIAIEQLLATITDLTNRISQLESQI